MSLVLRRVLGFRIFTKFLTVTAAFFLLSAFWGPCDRRVSEDLKIADFALEKNVLLEDLKIFTSEAHPFGSEAQKRYQEKLLQRLKSLGLSVYTQEFTAVAPNRSAFRRNGGPSIMSQMTVEKSGLNIFATPQNWPETGRKCTSLIGSHYDTKEIDGIQYLGANDGGSSTVGLIALAKFLNSPHNATLKCRPWFVWFDGEESVLDGWNDAQRSGLLTLTDNTYGSRHTASQLVTCEDHGTSKLCLAFDSMAKQSPIEEVVILDMIGHKNLIFSLETNSDKKLFDRLRTVLEIVKKPNLLGVHPKFIEDDHIPFKKRGIPVIDLINFEEIDTWHQENDTIENINFDSLAAAMQIVFLFLQTSSHQ